jgi:hypothetical protein
MNDIQEIAALLEILERCAQHGVTFNAIAADAREKLTKVNDEHAKAQAERKKKDEADALKEKAEAAAKRKAEEAQEAAAVRPTKSFEPAEEGKGSRK